MITIHKSDLEGGTNQIDEIEPGSWVMLTDPTPRELARIQAATGIPAEDMKSYLDVEEISRVETEEDRTTIIVDIPSFSAVEGRRSYYTVPLTIIMTADHIITLCVEAGPLERMLAAERSELVTYKKTRMVLQLLYRSTVVYLRYLTDINALRAALDDDFSVRPRRENLVELFELDKSLIYLKTSIRSNEIVLERLLKSRHIKKYDEDSELLEDLIIENNQAMEMTVIYSEILDSTLRKMRQVMDHDLSATMKLLAAITVVIAVPTVYSGLFGMNVFEDSIPFANTPHGFWWAALVALLFTLVALYVARKKDWL